MDRSRIEQIIQYALLVAGDAGTNRGELGPIHLLKYVYLADLAHAEWNDGKTYTGAPWEFYKFGPWQASVHEQIEPAVLAIGAAKRTFDWGGEQDGVRYSAADALKLEALELEIPHRVVSAVKRAVREFDCDTYGLLEFVYRTSPMVRAAPNSRLDFTVAVREPRAEYKPAESATAKEQKKRRMKLRDMKESLAPRLQADIQRRSAGGDIGPPPRYDEVFQEGQEWLDSLAGAQLEPEGELEFDEGVWHSDGRREPEIS